MIDLPPPPPTLVLVVDEHDWMQHRTMRTIEVLTREVRAGRFGRLLVTPPLPPAPEKFLEPPVAMRPKELVIRSIDEDRYLRKKRNKALRAKHQPWRV